MIKEEQFWEWFKKNEAKYFFLHQIDDETEKERILNELEEQLHLYCEDLFFEVGGQPDQKQDLIITAQGDSDFFNNAECLVAHAPQLEHWNIIALKPAVEDSVIDYDGIKLSSEMMWFIPLSSKNSSKIGLRVYIENYNPTDEDKVLFATHLTLDNLLGEKSSGLDIGYIEIDNLPPVSERDDLIELSELPRYVKWKKAKDIA